MKKQNKNKTKKTYRDVNAENMESKNVKKAISLVTKYSEKTAIAKAKNENAEVLEIVRKKIERAKLKAIIEPKTGDFCRELVKNRLHEIAKSLPAEGYNMGSMIRVSFLGAKGICVYDDRTSEYSGKTKFRATHGRVYFQIKSVTELCKIHVIGGLVTVIEPGQKNKVKKCSWYIGEGKKQFWQLKKVDGFICGNFHAKTKEDAKAGFDRLEKMRIEREKQEKIKANYSKLFASALRKQYNFQDSLNAGNCEVGTRAFIFRCGLDSNRKYRGKFLLETAMEKSSSSVEYVKRMIKSKILVK